MIAWHLGLRYLRKRRAAWLALAAITLTVAVSVVVVSVAQGGLELTKRQVRSNESDITVVARWHGEVLTDTAERRQAIVGTPGIAAIAPMIDSPVLITSLEPHRKHLKAFARLDGIDWLSDSAIGRIELAQLHPRPVFDLKSGDLTPEERGTGFITPAWRSHLAFTGVDCAAAIGIGLFPVFRTRPMSGVIAGRELMYQNGLSVGEAVQVVSPDVRGAQPGRENAVISDTVGTGLMEVDRFTLLMPLTQAQRLTRLEAHGDLPAQVSGYRATTSVGADLRLLADALTYDKQRAETWDQRRTGNMVKSLEYQRNLMGLIMLCVQAIAVFIVYAVFSTLVAEKRHDIGVLLGIGATSGDIAKAFLVAGLFACLAGGLIGWALGWGILAGLHPVGEWLGVPLFPQDVFYSAKPPISFDPRIPLFFIGAMGVIGLAAVAIPAWRAGRIDPVEILREGG